MEKEIILEKRVRRIICLIRGQKVILDRDLAALYEVPTKALKQAVKRNPDRFPQDFMFVVTGKELAILRSQSVTSSSWGGTRYLPMAFTEQGVAMLSSVLSSPRAIQVNIAIMRAFVHMRRLAATHTDLARRLEILEKECASRFQVIFEAIRQLMEPPAPPRRRIGF